MAFDKTFPIDNSRMPVDRESMHPKETQILWDDMTKAIKEKRLEDAKEIKMANEEMQRKEENERKADGKQFEPQFFVNEDNLWKFKWDTLFHEDFDGFCESVHRHFRRK